MTSEWQQTTHLFKLLLHMKRWKFLWFIMVVAAALSNHIIYLMADSWLGTMGQSYVDLGAAEFTSKNRILIEEKNTENKVHALKEMLKVEGVNDMSSLVENCRGVQGCQKNIFQVMYSRLTDPKFSNFINYFDNGNTTPRIECQMSHGGELNCPYLGNLAGISQHEDSWKHYHYRTIRFFSLTSHAESKKVTSKDGKSSKCASYKNFEAAFSRTITVQCSLIVATLSFYFLVSTQACIGELKRKGFLQLMFQKGLSVGAYWKAIMLMTLAEIFVINILFVISLSLQCPGYFKIVHILLVFFLSLIYMIALLETGLLFTVIFANYFYVGLFTVTVTIVSMVMMLVNRMVLYNQELIKVLFVFVLPYAHFGEFVQGVLLLDLRSKSLDFYNTTIMVWTFLLAVILYVIILLLDFTLETGNGLRLPGNFFTKREFWSTPSNSNIATSSVFTDDPSADPLYGEEPEPCSNIEPVDEGLQPLVRMSHLSKVFKSGKLCGKGTELNAINDMSGLIYENHITAIIGHNGAGKTTLLNLLMGAEVPTTGRVSICGVLASSPLERLQLRGKLGVCPQSTSFAQELSVEQTLRMQVISCGLDWEESEAEVGSMLRLAKLDNKRNILMGRLSAGQQRKLAVVMALIGNPRVLFLDEPTSGLDPESRRRMWRLLQDYRPGRAIILSTQFMDEADTLADRKIFLSAGTLLCAGSSLFFKSAFDCGFVFDVTLKIEKQAPLLRKHICDEFKSVKAKNRFGKNISFHLPAKDINFLPALAQAFEKRMSMISAFGLLQASLYEIFMKLKDMDQRAVQEMFREDREITKYDEDDQSDAETEPNRQLSSLITQERQQLTPSLLRQLRAMITMNVTRMVRTRLRLVCRVVVPAVLLVVLIVTAVVEKSNQNHAMQLRHNMTNDGSSIKSGVCVRDEGSEPEGLLPINAFNCAQRLLNNDTAAAIYVRRFRVMSKSSKEKLSEFLQLQSNIDKIEKTCRSRGSLKDIPCPIVYTNYWGDNIGNANRTIYIGSYIIHEKFKSTVSASVAMGVFQVMTAFSTKGHRRTKRLDKSAFFFTAQSVYDYRSTFVPTLGAFFQMLIVSFLPATFLDDIIEDKESRVRYQLASMGMSCLSYWLNNFIIHWLQYAVVYSLSAFLLLAIVQIGYSSSYFMMAVFLPTLFCGLTSNQIMVYVLSTIMEKSNHLVTIMYFFFSILLVVVVLLVQLNNVASIILIAALPPFATLALTFYGAKTLFYTLSFYQSESLSDVSEIVGGFFFSQPHVAASFAASIVHTVILLGTLVTIENRLVLLRMLEARLQIKRTSEPRSEEFDDIGVKEELERIEENTHSDENLMEMRHLSKTFPNGAKVVRDVSFATGPAEIFGLLGPNGAGKTTTLSMIVGQLRVTSGECDVRCKGEWMNSADAAIKGAVGYCPQFDPLYGCITAMEHLHFYASIMGVPKTDIESHINSLAETLGLDVDKEKPVAHLSYGNRRRLSLALALLGEPSVLVIDEATTGVDPEGKRFLWQAIRATATLSCTVVVTTHSMEEVEAICNRVAVLNRGLLVGMGTVQQLRTRYGSSYSLEILLTTSIGEDPELLLAKKSALVDAVTKKFNGTSVIEDFSDRVRFSIPVASINRLSAALSWLLDNRNALRVQYFSLHQMSMDQVFETMIKVHDRHIKQQRRTSVFSILSEKSNEE